MNYPQLLQHIMSEGQITHPRGQEIREVVKAGLVVDAQCNLYAWPVARPFSKITGYMWEELAWYLSGDRRAEHIKQHAGLWDKIKNPDETLNSNYGYLVFYNRTPHPSLGQHVVSTPFNWALNSLIRDRDSRQAIITYNTGGFNFEGNKDYICTQHQSFLIRDGYLRCFIALRSSDAIFGLPYNMVWWSVVHQLLFRELLAHHPDLKLGQIEVDIYSAHIYKHHYKLVEDMLAETPEKYWANVQRPIPIVGQKELDWYRKHIRDYVSITKQEAAK